jgi:hypothetical protein
MCRKRRFFNFTDSEKIESKPIRQRYKTDQVLSRIDPGSGVCTYDEIRPKNERKMMQKTKKKKNQKNQKKYSKKYLQNQSIIEGEIIVAKIAKFNRTFSTFYN